MVNPRRPSQTNFVAKWLAIDGPPGSGLLFDPVSGTDVNMADGFEAVGLTDEFGSVRWRPRRDVFTYRFIRPVVFEDTYLITGTPTRRTRRTLGTSTTIVSESSGHTVADATSVNQFIQRTDGEPVWRDRLRLVCVAWVAELMRRSIGPSRRLVKRWATTSRRRC
jgi:hypothetical protein